jgi:hypothetical protein
METGEKIILKKLIKKNEKEIKFMFDVLKDVDPDITMERIMSY